MRRFIYILVSIIISYLICVYEYNTWNFIAGLEPSPACERLAKYAFYFVILDDDSDMLLEQAEHFVKTDTLIGIVGR